MAAAGATAAWPAVAAAVASAAGLGTGADAITPAEAAEASLTQSGQTGLAAVTTVVFITASATITDDNATVSPSSTSTGALYHVSDPTVNGTLFLLLIALAVSAFCLLVYELIRRKKSMQKIFYTRIETCRPDAPEVSPGWFGWIRDSTSVPEEFLINRIGLDAVMFLRFLRMSFFLFGTLMVFTIPVLTPINYFSGVVPSNFTTILTADGTQFSKLGLFRFSISNVEDKSVYLYVDALFVLGITILTWHTLYCAYRDYASLATNYLLPDLNATADGPAALGNSVLSSDRPAWRQNEQLQLRTVIVQNVPAKLRTDDKLRAWVESLGIGEIESAVMERNWSGRNATKKLLERRERTLRKLEVAYMEWVKNISDEKSKRVAGRKGSWAWQWLAGWWSGRSYGPRALLSAAAESKIGEHSDGSHQRVHIADYLDEPTIQSLRPKMRNFGTALKWSATKHKNPNLDPDDAIAHYTIKLSQLTAMVKEERRSALTSEISIGNDDGTLKFSATAFVTFKTQRAAQIAAQTLLYTSDSPHEMRIRPAPSPQDIIWSSISVHPLQRSIQSVLVAALVLLFTFFWIVPASFCASLANIEELAKIPALASFVQTLAANPQFYFYIKTIIPPLVVNLFNMIMPFIIEFLVAKQGLEAYSWVEMRSLSYYFFFLIFNTLLVFTLSSTVWNIIGNFFRDPVSIFSLLAATLPSGATFFINYIIINTMFFPIELLRPGMLIYSAFKRWTHKTPREIHEENLSTSYLNFGMLYPLHILIFIIVLLYSVVAPLILIPGTIYFGLGLLIYRNQLLYVYVKEWEAYGRHWVMAYKRLIIGLEIFLVTMTGMLISKGAGTAAVVPMVLIPLTSLFYTYTRDAFERRTRLIPLEKLPVSPATTSAGSPLFEVQPSPLDLLPRHIAGSKLSLHTSLPKLAAASQDCLAASKPELRFAIDDQNPFASELDRDDSKSPRLSTGAAEEDDDGGVREEIEPDVVLSAEEHQLERYPVSYLNPLFSKPLPKPWLPLAIAQCWSLLPRYNSDGCMLDGISACHLPPNNVHEGDKDSDEASRPARSARKPSLSDTRGVLVVAERSEVQKSSNLGSYPEEV